MAPTKIAVAGATGRVGRHLVEALEGDGHDVVAMSRSSGVDVVTGDGLAEALSGVECVLMSPPGRRPTWRRRRSSSPRLLGTCTRPASEPACGRMVVVSIIGCDRFTGGYNAAKVAHERAALSGPIPVRLLRAAQFHEFVEQLVEWGTQGEVSYVPKMRTQLVASQTVAQALADLATDPASSPRQDPERRSRRSPVHGWRASLRWRGCSRRGELSR